MSNGVTPIKWEFIKKRFYDDTFVESGVSLTASTARRAQTGNRATPTSGASTSTCRIALVSFLFAYRNLVIWIHLDPTLVPFTATVKIVQVLDSF